MTLKQKYYGRVFQQNGLWKISVQKNGVRKSFYSSLPGDVGRKNCVEKVIQWLGNQNAALVSEKTTVDKVFQKFLADKELETSDIYNIKNRYNNHIKPVIGNLRILCLSVQDMKRVITTAHSKHNLSKKTLMNIRGDLSAFCIMCSPSQGQNNREIVAQITAFRF